MNTIEIISDALVYPLRNIKKLVLFIVLGIIAAFIGGASLLSFVGAASTDGIAYLEMNWLEILKFFISLLIVFLIEGYGLDIIKFSIERRTGSPEIDIRSQTINASKIVAIEIIYYFAPLVFILILGLFFNDLILVIITLIFIIVFSLADIMARCRLAKMGSLTRALAIEESIKDIPKVGVGKLLVTTSLIVIITYLIIYVIDIIYATNINLGSILLGITLVYWIFFYHRAIGLLYSNIY